MPPSSPDRTAPGDPFRLRSRQAACSRAIGGTRDDRSRSARGRGHDRPTLLGGHATAARRRSRRSAAEPLGASGRSPASVAETRTWRALSGCSSRTARPEADQAVHDPAHGRCRHVLGAGELAEGARSPEHQHRQRGQPGRGQAGRRGRRRACRAAGGSPPSSGRGRRPAANACVEPCSCIASLTVRDANSEGGAHEPGPDRAEGRRPRPGDRVLRRPVRRRTRPRRTTRPGLVFFDLDGVRLLLDRAAPSALHYYAVADIDATVARLRDGGGHRRGRAARDLRATRTTRWARPAPTSGWRSSATPRETWWDSSSSVPAPDPRQATMRA